MLPPHLRGQMGSGGMSNILKQLGDMGFPSK